MDKEEKGHVAYLKNKEGYLSTFTEADMKLGYKATASSSLEDYRITGERARVYSYPEGRPYPLDDYFFLPASGFMEWAGYRVPAHMVTIGRITQQQAIRLSLMQVLSNFLNRRRSV